MYLIEILILAGWGICWLGWVVTDFRPGRTRLGRYGGSRAGILVLALLMVRGTVTGNPWLQGVGFVIFLLGLALAIWARVCIGWMETDVRLVKTGPYRVVRHPLYSGIVLAFVGTAIAVSMNWLIAALILGVYFTCRAAMQERRMARLIPGDYLDYKRSTKMLIPFVW
ncbi:MAG: isoprenylcysteine carboxylmethyltransferase family protein [Streptosporangiaceae bacterium]|jgi:protein-S-isoprenylcysteine O-methyltransferase Ste14